MSSSKIETIVHPVRLRIITTVAGRELTPQQIARALPDVPQATLYRHIARLAKAEILTVVRETPVRGAVEKVYTLARNAARVDPKEWASSSREEHLRYFTGFVASLLNQYRLYLQQEQVDLLADGVSYSTEMLNLSRAEYEELLEDLRAALQKADAKPEAPDRRRIQMAIVLFPERREPE